SRELATRTSTLAVLPRIARILAAETRMSRVWIALGAEEAGERVAADTEDGAVPSPSVLYVLRRTPGDEPAHWVRVHQPGPRRSPAGGLGILGGREAYRVRVTAGTVTLGSVWSLRDRGSGEPDRTETRLLAAAADQIGQALAADRLAAEAQAAEIARQSDALKSALLQSVSHDLRTPLATIRAAAGSLRPGSGLTTEDQAESVDAIDREVEYLDRLVANLLDLSRIEAGVLRADRDVFELEDLVGRSLERVRPRLGGRSIEVDLAAPPVDVDPIFVDEALSNLLDNAAKYTPLGTKVRVSARPLLDEGLVRLTVEDDGPGVPPEAMARLFDKFYRVPGGRSGRAGTGIGLAVVRGMIDATGGRVEARRSDLGGLAIDLDLPAATVPADLLTPASP
ncbi:MAG TPA: ATP-binding protein, partial [Candidatus Dormibacteraeota bacterium]|nr:ATP-binding protein [Candidatus Dormibacteraeota bacterium]